MKIGPQIVELACGNHRPIRILQSAVTSINYARITVIFESNLYPIKTHLITKFDENRPSNSRVSLRKPSTNQNSAICCNVINYAWITVIFERNLYRTKTHIIAKFDENRSTNTQVWLRKPNGTEGRTDYGRTDGRTDRRRPILESPPPPVVTGGGLTIYYRYLYFECRYFNFKEISLVIG